MHTGRVVLNPDDCDVRALFEQIIRETPHTDALRIEIDRCDDAPLYCDPSHVREALTNLVGNAVEAMRGSGRITLSYVRMTPAAQKRIFEPYYTTKTSGENFGLGLYYCQNVMNVHEGSIRVSSAPGKGCTFTLIFPLAAQGRRKP